MVFDPKLIYKYHIVKAAKKDIKATLVLKDLKNLKLEITCQLYILTVILVINNTSPIWVSGAILSCFDTLDTI